MKQNQRHIAILCSYLHVPGGYEKAMVTAANLFVQKGNRVTIVILDTTKEIFYPLHPSVQVIQQPLSFGITQEGNIISRKLKLVNDVLKLRKLLRSLKCTHIIATEYPFATAAVLCGAGKQSSIMSWEHHHFGTVKKNKFWQRLSNYAYKELNAIVCLNEDERKYYSALNKRSFTIPNFITPPETVPVLYEQHKKTDILTVTRFNHIKGIDLFMPVAKTVLQSNPTLTWKVIGYGVQEEEVKQFIEEENLSQQLFLQHATDTDITAAYQQASIFVMTSRNECFPLVLLEAMNNGLPCIAFDCNTGPRHIIQPAITGLLIEKENTNEMAAAISKLIMDKERRKQMSDYALAAVQQFFPDKVYEQWEKLFQ